MTYFINIKMLKLLITFLCFNKEEYKLKIPIGNVFCSSESIVK